MHKFLAAVLLTALTAPSGLAQGTVSFTRKRPGKGDVRSMTSKMRMKMKVAIYVDGRLFRQFDQTQSEDEASEVTILAGSGDNVTKVRLEVTKQDKAQVGPQGERKMTSPLCGKLLVLDKDSDGIHVVDREGSPVDRATERAAKREAREVFEGKIDFFSRLLPNRAVKVGERIKVEGDDAIEFFGSRDKTLQDAGLTLTLKGTKTFEGRTCAEFEIVLTMSGSPQKQLSVKGELKGILLIDTATTWPCKMKIAGPVTMKGESSTDRGKIEVDGEGKMAMEMTAKYSKK